MKLFRLFAASILLAAIFVFSANAQTPARPTTPANPQGTGTSVAVIDSNAFGDNTNGIRRLVNAVNGVNTEFEPRRRELQQLQQRLQTLTQTIQSQSTGNAPVAPEAIQRQRTEAEALQVEITRKTEDAQRAYQQRLSAALSPIYDDIGRALQEFAQSRGIGILIDAGRMETPSVFVFNNALNVTADFIAEYNRRNPAAAAAAAPAANRPATTPAATRPATTPAGGRRP